MPLGTLTCLYWPTPVGLALGAVLEDAALTPVVMFTMREAAALAPRDPTRLIGALTAAFGIGQIIGPLVAATLASHRHGFAAPLELAGLATHLALLLALALAFVRARHSRGCVAPNHTESASRFTGASRPKHELGK